MELSKPIWNPQIAGLLIRIPLGFYFYISGRMLQKDVSGLIDLIRSYQIVPDDIATLYALTLPYIEITIGILLVLGLFTTLAAMVAAILLASFIYAIGLFPDSITPFNKDILWFTAALSLLASGAGSLSIDRFRSPG